MIHPADAKSFNELHIADDVRGEANAHLIAAAPEMLRIMKEIHYVIEQEEMICPSCGILCCSDDCELAEIIAQEGDA